MNIKNRYLAALFKTVLLAGFVHLSILAVLTIMNPSFTYLNSFSILGISELIPGMDKGFLSFFVATLIAVASYLFFFYRSRNKN